MDAKLFIYDFDGTLVDTLHLHLAAYRTVLSRFGITLDDRAIVEKCFNRYDDDIADSFGIDRKRFHDLYEGIALESRRSAKPIDGLLSVFDALKERGAILAVYSMDWEEHLQKAIKDMGIALLFSTIKGNLPPSRTKTEMITAICRELGVAPGATVVVGDADNDILSAKEIGASAVLYYPPASQAIYPLETLTKHHPDHVIRRHEEILDL